MNNFLYTKLFHCEDRACDNEAWAIDEGYLFCMDHFMAWLYEKRMIQKGFYRNETGNGDEDQSYPQP